MQLPSNVSPVSASFIGLKRQGIHRVLCVACSFLPILLFCLWFSVFLLAEVLSKIEGISCIQLCKCVLGMIPNNWRVETRQFVCLCALCRKGLPGRPGSGGTLVLECVDSSGSSRLPRKEVIQPHLPVRLPCYDFTPITDPTLDACLS
jgi:hypothetical protein